MVKKKYYAVKIGRNTGIYSTLTECEKQVEGFKKAEYRAFATRREAENYLGNMNVPHHFLTEQSQIKELFSSNEETLEVHIDGSYNSERKIAGYGLVIVKNNKPFLKDFSAYPYEDVIVSHNIGIELLGAKRAVELALANDYKRLIIHYDYVGIEKFATGEWHPKTKQTIEYQLFMKKYMKHLKIQFVKVKAHSGNRFNEMADQLAKFATHL